MSKQDPRKMPNVVFFSPLLLFAVLVVPYQWINSTFLVDRFGCGCPQVDAAGNLIQPAFNANDVTALFWGAVAVCVIGISIFLSRKINRDRIFLRIVYVLIMCAASLGIAYFFSVSMMWR